MQKNARCEVTTDIWAELWRALEDEDGKFICKKREKSRCYFQKRGVTQLGDRQGEQQTKRRIALNGHQISALTKHALAKAWILIHSDDKVEG